MKEESEKAGLKFNIQKTKIMAWSPITVWQIDVETLETLRDFIFLGSKITAEGDCSHEIKRHLLFGIKAITNLDTILKSRDNTLPTKVRLAAIYGVAQSRTRLSTFTFTFHFDALEKEMATHSSVLAWRIPGTGDWWAAVDGVAQSPTRSRFA